MTPEHWQLFINKYNKFIICGVLGLVFHKWPKWQINHIMTCITTGCMPIWVSEVLFVPMQSNVGIIKNVRWSNILYNLYFLKMPLNNIFPQPFKGRCLDIYTWGCEISSVTIIVISIYFKCEPLYNWTYLNKCKLWRYIVLILVLNPGHGKQGKLFLWQKE